MHFMPKMLNLLQVMDKSTKQFLALFISTLVLIIAIIATIIKPLLKNEPSDKPETNNDLTYEKTEPALIVQENIDISRIKEKLKQSGILPQEAKYWKTL